MPEMTDGTKGMGFPADVLLTKRVSALLMMKG